MLWHNKCLKFTQWKVKFTQLMLSPQPFTLISWVNFTQSNLFRANHKLARKILWRPATKLYSHFQRLCTGFVLGNESIWRHNLALLGLDCYSFTFFDWPISFVCKYTLCSIVLPRIMYYYELFIRGTRFI